MPWLSSLIPQQYKENLGEAEGAEGAGRRETSREKRGDRQPAAEGKRAETLSVAALFKSRTQPHPGSGPEDAQSRCDASSENAPEAGPSTAHPARRPGVQVDQRHTGAVTVAEEPFGAALRRLRRQSGL